MSEISTADIKLLRERTGAGMMDCKKALVEAKGDIEEAIDWLRKKGLAAAAKKSGRVASEGLVGLHTSGVAGALVEVNSETDFVARNEIFQTFVRTVAELSLKVPEGDLAALLAMPYPNESKTVGEQLNHLIATIGENMSLRRHALLTVQQGVVVAYLHNSIADKLGRIGVLVAIESSGESSVLNQLGKQVAMHIAATNPVSLSVEEVPADLLEREKSILIEQAKASGRPEAIIAKMVEGRVRKFYEESVLLEQSFVMNPDKTVSQVVQDVQTQLGTPVRITRFVRFALGEGIEKAESDFAAEVAAVVKG